MKKHLYIFNFKEFIFKFLLSVFILNILSILFMNIIFVKSDFRLNKLFNGNYDKDKIIIGNSRSFSIIFNTKDKKIINFSYNKMTYKEILLLLSALEDKKVKAKVFLEITSLKDDNFNCEYHTFLTHRYFDESLLKDNCILEYYLSKYVPIHRLNSEFFYRIVYYYFFKNDQKYVSKIDNMEFYCGNNELGFYDPIIKNKDKRQKIFNRIENLKKKFSNIDLNFFILPYLNASNSVIKDYEKYIHSKFLDDVILINNSISSDFYNDCQNFNDKIHLSTEGILKIDFEKYIK